MAIIYNDSVKEARLQIVADAIGSGGTLEVGTAGMSTVLAIFELNDPPGDVTPSSLTFSGLPKTVDAIGSGFAASARVKDSSEVVIISGMTVGVGAADIILDSVNITSGQKVQLNSAVINHG